MLLRNLRLPEWDGDHVTYDHPTGRTMLYNTGEVVEQPRRNTDITWDELSGPGTYNPYANSNQPFVGCPTGGDIIAERLMQLLMEP